jgi:chorismate dehydratase
VEAGALTRALRIGAVEYLNARPLVWNLVAVLPGARLTLDLPSALVSGLASGTYDAALIPVAAYLQGIGEGIVDRVSIASRGSVGTVMLFARCPLEEVETLAVDRASRTSVLLARAALSALYGVRPQCTEIDPHLEDVLSKVDAAVVIGQDRLVAREHPPEAVVSVDLGELWTSWQRLPLVTAVWAFARGSASPEAAEALRAVREAGVAAIPRIAQIEAAPRGLTPEAVSHYLTEMLDYGLGPEHIQGILRYQEVLLREGLLDRPRELSLI